VPENIAETGKLALPQDGPVSWTVRNDLAVAAVLGRDIVREISTQDVYRQKALEHGFPAPIVGMLVSMFEAMRDGEFNVVDPTLEGLLGRRPVELRKVLSAFFSSDALRA
jgi:hypothetical protein